MRKLITILYLALPLAVQAGIVDGAVADTSRVVDLDQVVVVAQPKEAFLLRQQPLSSSVFGSAEMHNLEVRDLRQLSAYVPSFSMPQYGSRLTSSMYIRGLGSRISNSAVGVYYDNVPLLSPATFNSHFYMLDRVDVLRGPQGTLYGANSEGGIVRIYSKDPMHYQGTDVSAGIGSHFTRHAELAHFHRPTEQLAFSVAGFYNGQEGFFRNENLNRRADGMDEAGAKLRLMWKPSERFTLDWTTDYQYSRQNGFSYGSYDVAEEWATQPSTTFLPTYRRNMVNSGLSLSFRPTDGLLLTSTTSYQLLRDRMLMDIDYTPRDMMSLVQRQKGNALTEELTLRSTDKGRWQHTSGVFASRQWLRTDADVTFGQDMLRPIAAGIVNSMKTAMAQGMMGRFLGQGMTPAQAQTAAQAAVEAMGVNMSAEMAVPNAFHLPQTNLAAYHESNYDITSRLRATLGLRLDYTKTEIDYDAFGYMAMTGGTANAVATNTLSSHLVNNHSTSFTQLLPKMGLTWRLDDVGSNIYLTVGKGFMAGGYNFQLFSDILQSDLSDPVARQQAQRGDVEIPHTPQDYADIEDAISYKPEESWNYELGIHLNLFDHRLHLDASSFYTQLRNQQLTVMAPEFGFGRMTVNAGRSNTCGLELAMRGQTMDNHLMWTAAYSFTHADFREYLQTDAEGNTVNYRENNVPYVPAHVASATADYRFGGSRDALLRFVTVGVSFTGQGKTYWDDANTASQGFYALLGAHVNVNCGAFDVDFWGRNITDTKYCTFAMPFSGAYIGQRGLPRTVGVDIRLHL